jgi:hypothetical protein
VRVIRHTFVFGFVAAASLVASLAHAQTDSYSDVPDKFRIEIAGFQILSDTALTFTAGGQTAPPVDFEGLALPDSATRAYLEGFWRPGRRHLLSLSWYRHNREGDGVTLQRDIDWGGQVIHAGASATARVSSYYMSGVYRFAAYKNDRFEIGPALGLGYLPVEAGISGEGSTTAPSGGTTTRPFDVSRSLGQPTGDLGAYFYWWPARRLLVRSDFRYIIVKPENSEASITDARGALIYHIGRHVGLGFQYTYSKFRYDRETLSSDLGGRLRYSGGQVVLSGAF